MHNRANEKDENPTQPAPAPDFDALNTSLDEHEQLFGIGGTILHPASEGLKEHASGPKNPWRGK